MVSTQESLDRMAKLPAREKSPRSWVPHTVRTDQLVHAWSLGGGRIHARSELVVRIRKEECPPEVYIG